MSTGVPSPARTPTGSPGTAAGEAPPRERSAAQQESPARRQGWAPSPAIGGAELICVALAGVLLAIVTTWPLILHMPSRIAPDLGDPVRTAWEVAWVGHAILHQPLHLFDANVFYPHKLSLAFSDSLLGYGPAGLFGSGTVAALVRYNLLFLFAWSLCFFGAYLLARELGLGRLGGAAAGAAFAYAPYRVTEAGHLHVISSGGIPLALFLLLRGYRRGSRALVLAGWLLAAWQVSLGFTLGLQFCYLLGVLAVIAAFYWWRGGLRWPAPGGDSRQEAAVTPAHGGESPQEPGGLPAHGGESPQQSGAMPARGGASSEQAGDGGGEPREATGRARPAVGQRRGPLIPRQLLAVTLVGVAIVGVIGVYESLPYLKIAHDYPTAKRTLKEVRNYSSGPAAWLSASSENRVWGPITSGLRAKVHSKNESVFFPGGLILVLAVIGLAAPFLTRRLRLGLALGVLTCSLLALGLGLGGAGYPFRLLHDYAPGWDGVRVPGRVFTMGTLFYALLAGAGVQLLVLRVAPWARRRSLAALPAIVGVALAVAIVGEGAGHLAHPVVPQPARAEIGLPGPVMDLPTDGPADRLYQYFSTDGFYKIPQGNSTFDIYSVDDLRGGVDAFPDKASVEKLRYYGIRTVVLHLHLPRLPGVVGYAHAEPPDAAAAAAKPIAGLGMTRRRVGSLVIYEIGPGPKALHPH